MGITERREREKEQRQEAIVDAAEEVFFSKGLENATMDEVAETAELSKGTLYLYFKNKEDLYHAVVCRGLNILNSLFEAALAPEGTGLEKIEKIGRAYYEFYTKYPDYASALLHHEGQKLVSTMGDDYPYAARCSELGGKLFILMQETIQLGIDDGSMRPDLDPLKVALSLWGQSAGILQIASNKGAMLEMMLGLKPEDLIAYSFEMIRKYLEKNG